jgi:hypothetical protein
MSDRKGFRFATNGNVYWFLPLDRPIRSEQVNLFDSEFDAVIDKIMLKPRSKQARLTKKWRQHLNSITHDGYGSFRLDFDMEMADYTDAELQSFYDDILELVIGLPIVQTITHWISIEENTSYYIEEDGIEYTMNEYIDSVLESGYRLAQRDVEEMFNESNNPAVAKMIAQDFMLRKLRGQDVVCKEVSEVKETSMWPFNAQPA